MGIVTCSKKNYQNSHLQARERVIYPFVLGAAHKREAINKITYFIHLRPVAEVLGRVFVFTTCTIP